MSDPGKLDLSDWLSVALLAISGGIGSAMAWFKSSNQKRDDRMETLEEKMERYEELRAATVTRLAVIETCQSNLLDKMNEIKDNIERTAMQGAHSVNTQIAGLTNEIQKLISHNNRRGHE